MNEEQIKALVEGFVKAHTASSGKVRVSMTWKTQRREGEASEEKDGDIEVKADWDTK